MRHRLDAGSKFTGRGLFNRSARPVEFRITARAAVLVMIAALVLPTYFIAASNNTMARRGTGRHPIVPISAPPEVYGLAAPSSHATGIIGMTTSAVAGVSEFFTAPPAPAGIDIPREPSPAERTLNKAANAINSLVAARSKPSSEPIAPPMASPTPAGPVHFDFDGDAKADIGRWRSNSTEFRVKKSGGGSDIAVTIGSSSAKPAPGDYDNAPDGKTDVALFNAGTWTVRSSATGTTSSFTWGAAGDIPVAGDYDGDGTTDAAVYRPSTNTWWVLRSSDGGYDSTSYGSSGDIPVLGNFDTDAKSDKAVYRPSTGYWYVTLSGGGSIGIQWGIASDIPVPADYNNDGKTDMAVFRGTTGVWYVYYTGGGGAYTSQTWGNYGDQPAPADYDGDGKADYCVWRPTSGEWWISKSSDSSSVNPALGVPGDFAVSSAYIKQIGGPVTGYDMATARLSPKNATGGTNLYSQNFAWGTSLVSLPGRAGMDAGLGIGYNSLVWIKSGGAMYFDPDTSNVAPGFRMGFPTIEPIYYDTDKSKWAYLMVTPSGGRVEFRQTAASGVYETADSSYTQLVRGDSGDPNGPVEDISMTVKTTDGTQMSYEWNSGAYRCVKVTDRNGNYITAAYNSYGQLTSITDTLARIINVNYTEGYPSAITQTWRGDNGSGSTTTHTYASLSYTTKPVDTDWHDTNISAAYGPPEDTAVKVLDKVTYADGSSTKFEYNGYLQVKKISNLSAETTPRVLNAVETNLSAPPSDAEDCPRLSETGTTVENFNGGSPVVVKNTLTTGQTFSPPDLSPISATRIQVWVEGHPDNLRSNTFVAASGWKEGLPVGTEDCITTSADCTTRKRWTWSEWTQDNTGVSYIVNPRVTENRVGDGTNVKKSQTEYWADSGVATYGLVKESRVYDSDLSTILKKSVTEYNLSSTYTNRRIIGLPSKVEAWGRDDVTNGLEYVSKVTFGYDEEDFTVESNQNISSVIRHDTAYSASFVAGRGNLTSTTRHDVTGATSAVTSKIRYDIAGSPVAKLDPLNRKVAIEYADAFNDTSTTRNTYAYATKLSDPAGNYSEVKYRFDLGANVWAKSPDLNTTTTGKETTRIFDTVGRILKETIVNSGAYTRYEYFANSVQSRSYSTIVDADSDGADQDDEVLSESWEDGAGRMRMSRSEHPGSTGGWTASQVEYDLLGRVKRQSVPTEVSVSGSTWTPSGDDNRGTGVWLWTYQKYDWKGRVVRRINTDGVDSPALNDSDEIISYEGCGCAGGMVTSIRGALVPVPGQTNVYARRSLKIYEDILGRTIKTETMNWDETTPYTTTTSQFNGRDQAVSLRQYEGSESGTNPFQVGVMTYDGHGRLKSQHKPEQSAGSNTTFNYNMDDSIESVIDARGAIESRNYEARGLLISKSYTVPQGSDIPVTPTISFQYDSVGNRTQMSDETGTTAYHYDQLSRITSETKTFNQISSDVGMPNQVTVSYEYGLTSLKKVIYPDSRQVNYSYQKNGSLNLVDGYGFTGNYGQSAITSNYQYRAWGGIKHITNANGKSVNYTYNNRLKPLTYEVTGVTTKSYQYTNDGFVKYVSDSDERHDRSYQFDQVGRTIAVTSNHEARGQSGSYDDLPLKENSSYDVFGNILQTGIYSWGGYYGDGGEYSNNRRTNKVLGISTNPLQWEYDAEGQVVVNRSWRDVNNEFVIDTTNYKIDAAGRGAFAETLEAGYSEGLERLFRFDGDGRNVIQREDHFQWTQDRTKRYEVWSSVFGKPLLEYTGDCTISQCTISLAKLNIYDSNGTKIATGPHLQWENIAPTGSSVVSAFDHPQGQQVRRTELTPLGSEVQIDPPASPPDPDLLPPSKPEMGSIEAEYASMCTLNGIDMLCRDVTRAMRSGECEYASCSVQDSHGDYIFRPEAEFGPTDPLGGKCGFDEICEIVQQELARRNREALENAIQNNDLKALLRKAAAASGQIDAEFDIWIWLKKALQQVTCDQRLSRIFGNGDSHMATLINPPTLNHKGWRGPATQRKVDEAPENGAAHLYSNYDGLGVNTINAFTPPGYYDTDGYARHKGGKKANEFQNARRFYYKPGSLSSYGYSGGLIINFTHIGATDRRGNHLMPTNKTPNAAGSVPVGTIGGFGSTNDVADGVGGFGEGGTGTHSHMIFRKLNGTLIDPRSVFCGNLGF